MNVPMPDKPNEPLVSSPEARGTASMPPEQWTCFHCGFFTSDHAEAEAHFGERDDAREFTPTCTWWAKLSREERAQEFQTLRQELNAERFECARLNTANEGLEYRLIDVEHVIDSRFRGCGSINDIFHLYDSMEGRALASEERVARLERALREAKADFIHGCHKDFAIRRIDATLSYAEVAVQSRVLIGDDAPRFKGLSGVGE